MSNSQSTETARLDDMLNGYGRDVLDRIDVGTPRDNDEAQCADEMVDDLDGGQRALLLQELLDEKASHVALVECALDETATSTYSAINGIGMILRAAVDTQGEQDLFLRRLVADAIQERASVARLVRKLDARREQGRFDPRGPVVDPWATTHRHVPPMPCDASCGPSFCAESCAEAAAS